MSNHIEDFVNQVRDYHAKTSKVVSDTFIDAMAKTEQVVTDWANEHHIIKATEMEGGYVAYPAMEGLKIADLGTTISGETIKELVDKIGVAEAHQGAAMELVASAIARAVSAGDNGAAAVFRAYGAKNSVSPNSRIISVESLYPAHAFRNQIKTLPLTAEAGQESFGINMDRVRPDLRTIISVGMLQFHTNLTPRICPIQTATQGNVTIVRETTNVYDMASANSLEPTSLLEIYDDPSLVSTKAKRIEPLVKNATNGELACEATADDVAFYAVRRELTLFKLARDVDRAGYDKFNHTDLVEDGVKIDKVIVEITKGEGENAKKNYFEIVLPYNRGRMTQYTDDRKSTIRRVNLDKWTAYLSADSEVKVVKVGSAVKTQNTDSNGKAETLADFTNGAKLALSMHVTGSVDRETSEAEANGYVGEIRVIDGDASKAAGIKVEVIGYALDARYNEDNKRKTSIRVMLSRNSMSYELPAGRNFVVDAAIGQEGQANASATLAQVEHIGRDYNNLTIIEEVLKSVHDQAKVAAGDKQVRQQLAAQYAAGNLVNPTVVVDTMDMNKMYGIRSSDAAGDIKAFAMLYFNGVTSKILSDSKYQQQLAEGATVTFRCICTNETLGNIFKLKQIHTHLNNDPAVAGGVEYAVMLDNGVKLEFVTTTFKSMKGQIFMIPYISNSQSSIFNFGQDWDQGTLVGALTIGTDQGASYHRVFSTTRELLIPTNVVGAIISVVGNSVDMTSDGVVDVMYTEG